MKPSELYARTPESVSKDLTYFHPCMQNHVAEIDWQRIPYSDQESKNTRIEIMIYKDPYIDGRRIWRVCAAFFDGKPVMAFQNGGREGTDHHRCFITNVERYNEMVKYIIALYAPLTAEDVSEFSETEEIPVLGNFYDSNLDDK